MRLTDVRSLADGVERLAVWLRRQMPRDISSSTVSGLERLRTDGPLRVSELAVLEGMTQPGVTLLINRMADSGWAERVPDPTDGRAALVRITPAGTAVLDRRHALRAQILRDRMAALSGSDRTLLLAALPAIERLVDVPAAAGRTASHTGK